MVRSTTLSERRIDCECTTGGSRLSATVESAKPPQKGFFGHPAALGPLFFTEFWERVSYYGMRAILLFFMYSKLSDGGLGLDPTLAKSLMSIYGASVFMSGVLGGWLA